MKTTTKATMREVARLAGVSISTVSAVINQTPKVSEKRSARVRDAMAALDYHPHQVARNLKTGKTQTIGVVIPDITNPFYPELVRGLANAARAAGYGVLLCDSNEDAIQERSHLEMLFSRMVDGVIVACTKGTMAYNLVIRKGRPVVFVDRLPLGIQEGTVCMDNVEAAFTATKHLIELGHEEIALMVGSLGLSPHAERLDGFRKAMQEWHLPVRSEFLREGDLEIEGGYATGKQLLQLKTPPTAIIASNNNLLLGLLRAMEEFKVECPKSLSILGFDDYVWNSHFNPRITTVAQKTEQMGETAFAMLLSKMNQTGDSDASDTGTAIRLRAQLVVRESTAAPPGDHNPAKKFEDDLVGEHGVARLR
jgi:LacI family transcriptional regulator